MSRVFDGPHPDEREHPDVHNAQKSVIHQVNTLKQRKKHLAQALGWDIKGGPQIGKSNGTLSKFMHAGDPNTAAKDKLSLTGEGTKEKALLILGMFPLPAAIVEDLDDDEHPPPSIEGIVVEVLDDDEHPPPSIEGIVVEVMPPLAADDDRAAKRQKCSDALDRRGL